VCVLPGTATRWLYILRNTSKVQDAYHEDGTPADKEATDKRTGKFIEAGIVMVHGSGFKNEIGATCFKVFFMPHRVPCFILRH
jgi:hypothetical protein